MFTALLAFWLVTALELLLALFPSSAFRRYLALFGVLLAVVSSIWLLAFGISIFTVLLLVFGIYRSVNLLRLAKARIHQKYLRRSSLKTAFWIGITQVLATLAWLSDVHWGLAGLRLWIFIAWADVVLALVLLASTSRHLWTTRTPRLAATDVNDAKLPTLTVAIPARNETDDLDACLTSLVASSYPKLEILVLDDCSQNKHTPEIIRSFAHAGVRFLQGKVPDINWLAKNAAYQQLYEEANGELLLFCGVDVRFQPNSLRELVAALQHKRKSMIALIPQNVVPGALTSLETTLLQPMRYAWEISLPRRLFRRPPVLSTCWLIRRDVVASAGGFAAVSRSIVPESYFARVSAVQDGYSFMQSSAKMGVTSMKSRVEQRATAVRTEYPRVHRRIELVMVLSLLELGGVVLPYILTVTGFLHKELTSIWLPSVIAVALLTITYIAVVALTYRAWLARALIQLPLAVAIDVFLLNYSMIRYEFFSVIWKDRNVCIPVMRVTDRLPEPELQRSALS